MRMLLTILTMLAIAGCAHHGHKGDSSKCTKKKWRMMDKDGDGKVTKEEWGKMSMEKWTTMDTNKDGTLTMEEMKMAKKDWKKSEKCSSCK